MRCALARSTRPSLVFSPLRASGPRCLQKYAGLGAPWQPAFSPLCHLTPSCLPSCRSWLRRRHLRTFPGHGSGGRGARQPRRRRAASTSLACCTSPSASEASFLRATRLRRAPPQAGGLPPPLLRASTVGCSRRCRAVGRGSRVGRAFDASLGPMMDVVGPCKPRACTYMHGRLRPTTTVHRMHNKNGARRRIQARSEP